MKRAVARLWASRYTRLVFGMLVGGVCLFFALRDVSFTLVLQELSHTKPLFVVAAVLVVLVNSLAKAMRWRGLIGEKGRQINFGTLFVSHMAGQTLNVVFPARLGDLSRAYLIGGKGPGRIFVLFTVLLEKIPDFVAFAALFVVLLLVIPMPGLIGRSGSTLAIITVAIMVFVLYITLQRHWVMSAVARLLQRLPEDIRRQAEAHLDSGFSSLDVLQNRADLINLIAWTVLVWVTALSTNQLVMLALDLHLPWTASLLVLVALQAAILIPSVPGKIGIFEYICVLSLGVFSVGQSEAFSYGVLLHAVVFLPILIFGLPIVVILETGDGHIKQLKTQKGEQL